MKKTLLVILAIAALLVIWGISAYNGMIGVQENATQAAADVQSAYQRRADLIPNLVETVKGYAKHEEQTLTEVTEARTRATSVTIDPSNMTAEQIQEFQKNWSDLNSSLGRLIAVAESYPELKANENFRDLQNQLEGSENRINEARVRLLAVKAFHLPFWMSIYAVYPLIMGLIPRKLATALHRLRLGRKHS